MTKSRKRDSHENEILTGLRRLLDESNGLLVTHVLRPQNMPSLKQAAESGDDRESAKLVFEAVEDTWRQVSSAAIRGRPKRCACCLEPVRSEAEISATIVVLAHTSTPTQAITYTIDAGCDDGGALTEIRVELLRAVFCNARAVKITHRDGGRA